MAHTPGQWYVHPTAARVDVFDQDCGPVPICKMLWPSEFRSEAETYANARLIAAAPELLVLLEQAEKCISSAVRLESCAFDEPPSPVSQWDYDAHMIALDIQTAIAKAKGEA